jgi:hypothetical protein
VLAVFLCGLGVMRISRTKGWTSVWWLCGPVLVTLGASMLGLFPIAPRLTLFLLPGLIVLFTAGLAEALSRLAAVAGPPRLAIAGAIVVVPMALHGLLRTLSLEPTGRFQRLVTEFHERRRAGEPVYVFARSLPAWIYYTTDWERPDTVRFRALIAAAGAGGSAFENAPSRGHVSTAEVDRLRPVAEAWGELLGLPSGMEWREVQEHLRTAPDSGWVDIEQRRIMEAANPGVWVVASAFYAAESDLFAALERSAVRRTFADTRPGSALVRYEFSGRASSR